MFLKTRKMAMALDESHTIKNPSAQTTASIMELRELVTKKIVISGTPVANKPEDLWSQFYFLDNGELLGDDYKEFKKKYSINLKEHNLSESQYRYEDLRNICYLNQ